MSEHVRWFVLILLVCSQTLPARAEEVQVRLFAYQPGDTLALRPIDGDFTLRVNDREISLSTADNIQLLAQNGHLLVQLNNRQFLTDLAENCSAECFSAVLCPNSHASLLAVSDQTRTRRYRGQFQLRVLDGKPAVINHIEFEDYLKGVIASEIEADAPAEALKAQAVVSRSYARSHLKRHAGDGYDFCDLTHCQIYQGFDAETEATNRAVAETKGEVLYFQGQPLEALFCANCGGQTADPMELWAPNPALISVKDDACQNFPHFRWHYEISTEKLHGILQADTRTDPGELLRGVTVDQYGPSQRVMRVRIVGDKSKMVDGFTFWAVLAAALKWGKIKSTRFEIQQTANGYLFIGQGFGHGLGLCQSGARSRAERGDSYRQILQHYFPRADLRTENE